MADLDSVIFYQPVIDAPTAGTFIDTRDGTGYNWVKIGDQIWMAENLRYLPSVVGPGAGSQTIPYYYVYDYDGTDVTDAKASVNYETYGVLYNWSSAMDGAASSTESPSGVQGVCPSGWHLPSDADWTKLTDYLGGESVSGGKLKETGRTHWNTPNTGATNETGFTALPGGDCNDISAFNYIGNYGYWWSATEGSSSNAWQRKMHYVYSNVFRSELRKELGLSVRCLKDTLPQLTTYTLTLTTNPLEAGTTFGTGQYEAGQEINLSATTNAGWRFSEWTQSGETISEIVDFTYTMPAENITLTARFKDNSKTDIVEVLNPVTGQIWMDRNLGASRAAISRTDTAAYGSLYQWGRGGDGHEKRTSGTTTNLSSGDIPGHGYFIINEQSPLNWRSTHNANLWQGVSGINNPCPDGYRLPTEAELEAERISWESIDSEEEFLSPLKMPAGGVRRSDDGSNLNVGFYGVYWSSSLFDIYSKALYISGTGGFISNNSRASGASVRCIKE
ncbi:FISUMP domain-containing protein [Geofilum rubicundum]|nr:FISUMP domain-containing protein [Geofilum rubicundum]